MDNKQYNRRGIKLIRHLCESLEYSNGERRAAVVFVWENES